MPHALLADLIVFTHLLVIAFIVGGQVFIVIGAALRWSWVRQPLFRAGHLVAIVVVAGQALAGVPCPLTVWEHWCREQAGQLVDTDISFVGRIVRGIIYYELPAWVFTTTYVTFALLVIATLVLVPPRLSRRPAREQSGRAS